ncbi:hypothetical protein DFJ73DRAFT_812438 [Zopfochytrium polystomum]|nr:hypothetical protein DFJ73DRAFT_812438 [Zopfochytrium polystomum]
MPPKKGGQGGEKKGRKQEADKALSEEEEKKRLEEEQRLQELRAKKERELREQREQEALFQIYTQEKPRLNEEADSIRELVTKLNEKVLILEEKIEAEKNWKKFIACDTLPNPLNERDLNTFISFLEEEPVSNEDDPSIDPFVAVLPSFERLCNDISLAIAAAADRIDKQLQQNLQMHLLTIRALMEAKWDLATNSILQHFDHFPLEPNENFYYSLRLGDYFFGLWGNLTKNPRHKVVEYSNVPLSMTLPKPISLANVSIRMLYMSGLSASAPFIQETGPQMAVVGGVLHLDLFEMPEAPKTIDSWIIRQILSPTGKLRRVEYPFKKTVAEAAEEESDGTQDTNVWPAQVGFEIFPSCFIHRESAKVMAWDFTQKCWSEENLGDVEINVETGHIKFRAMCFRPTALVQKKFSEFPLENWTLSPLATNRAILKVNGRENEIEIEILGSKCRLLSPTSSYIKEHLQDAWLTPSLLLMRLSLIGLNFIGPKSLQGVDLDDVIVKHPSAEDVCTIGIKTMAHRFAFRRHPSNRHIGSSKIVFQTSKVKPDYWAEEWKTIMYDCNHKFGESFQAVGFMVSDGDVTDETKYDINTSDRVKVPGLIITLTDFMFSYILR